MMNIPFGPGGLPPEIETEHSKTLGPPDPAKNERVAELSVFRDDGYKGWEVRTTLDVPKMIGNNYNDEVSSIIIYSGTWQFFQDWSYGGACLELGPGHYPSVEQAGIDNLGQHGWNDTISSYRCKSY